MTALYIGVQLVKAKPMSQQELEGYLVEYLGGDVIWIAKGEFERAFREVRGMRSGMAIEALRMGRRATRAGWGETGIYLEYVPAVGQDQPYLRIVSPQGERVPYTPSMADLLAEDWEAL